MLLRLPRSTSHLEGGIQQVEEQYQVTRRRWMMQNQIWLSWDWLLAWRVFGASKQEDHITSKAETASEAERPWKPCMLDDNIHVHVWEAVVEQAQGAPFMRVNSQIPKKASHTGTACWPQGMQVWTKTVAGTCCLRWNPRDSSWIPKKAGLCWDQDITPNKRKRKRDSDYSLFSFSFSLQKKIFKEAIVTWK